jgi:hypothetical protein
MDIYVYLYMIVKVFRSSDSSLGPTVLFQKEVTEGSRCSSSSGRMFYLKGGQQVTVIAKWQRSLAATPVKNL